MALATVSRWLKRIGLGKRSRLAPPEPPNRYQRGRPGELVHVDIKTLGRFAAARQRVTGDQRGRASKTTAAGSGRGVVRLGLRARLRRRRDRLAFVEDCPTSAARARPRS